MLQMKTFLKLLILIAFIYVCEGQVGQKCENKKNCGTCIQELDCVWCSKPHSATSNLAGECAHESKLATKWCPTTQLKAPQTSFRLIQNDDLDSGKNRPAVQMKPQNVKLQVRKGLRYNLTFQYAKASNYELDLYYIIDHSASMKPHKNKLAMLGNELVSVMRNITTNFKLGFGSFVDKAAMPFVSEAPSQEYPCTGCAKPYSFINHLPLTSNYDLFSKKVAQTPLSGNVDSPEGGFDALIQAIVCKIEIGWRPKARHLVVFSTDDLFHVAGDGRLAGVAIPNDARCHMVNNTYNKYLVYDYPSVSFLNHVARENNVNLIFAIDRAHVDSYRELQKAIDNSGVGELTDGSSNVVDLILKNYNEIIDTVTINDDSPSSIKITYRGSCAKDATNVCMNLHAGEVVNFTATIEILECFPGTQRIKIKPEGINEALLVELEALCVCDCEKSDDASFEASSPSCNLNGNLQCGVCACDSNHFGKTCHCDKTQSSTEDVASCINANDTNHCSGRGQCICGECVCDEKSKDRPFTGPYCECDDYACKKHNSLVCSGDDRGKCECGTCRCLAGWTGEACECPDSTKQCISSNGNGKVCSGNGDCVCGECQCKSEFSGKYCGECISCPGQRCEELSACVNCQAYGGGPFNAEECKQNCSFTTEIVSIIDENEGGGNVKLCRILDDHDCTITFQYSYDDDDKLIVEAAEEKSCPKSVDVLIVVLSALGSVLLAGIIMLVIWKCFTNWYDRREYAKFEEDRANMKWGQHDNPLYNKAKHEYINPTYGKRR